MTNPRARSTPQIRIPPPTVFSKEAIFMGNIEIVYHNEPYDLPPNHWGPNIKIKDFNAEWEWEQKDEYRQRSQEHWQHYNDNEEPYLNTDAMEDAELRQLKEMRARNLRLTWNNAEKKKGKANDDLNWLLT